MLCIIAIIGSKHTQLYSRLDGCLSLNTKITRLTYLTNLTLTNKK